MKKCDAMKAAFDSAVPALPKEMSCLKAKDSKECMKFIKGKT